MGSFNREGGGGELIIRIRFASEHAHPFVFSVGTFQMRQVPGDDVIHRTIDTAFQCGYRLIGKLYVNTL